MTIVEMAVITILSGCCAGLGYALWDLNKMVKLFSESMITEEEEDEE